MIAQRMSARVMPTLLGVWGIGASLFKAFGLAMVKFLTAIVWDGNTLEINGHSGRADKLAQRCHRQDALQKRIQAG